MFKNEFWGQIKTAAKAEQNPHITKLDQLVTEYHTNKGNLDARHKIALEIDKTAMQAQRYAGRADGVYVAASILRVSANDTLARLEFDLQAKRTTAETGKQAKPMIKKHRAEALDPEHHKWGLMLDFNSFREKWKAELIGIASGANSEQVMLSSFYDYLAGQGKKIREQEGAIYAPKVKYDPEWKASKRIVFATPHHMNNPHDQVCVMRMAKPSRGGSGAFDVYDSKGRWSNFILDREGFSACKASMGKDGKAKHHSSLAGGNAILGAGMMLVENGRIQQISQQSGHYHPTRQQMLYVLEELERSGVDLSEITLQAYTYAGDPNGEVPDQEHGTNLPIVVPVPADYYLQTKGQWPSTSQPQDRPRVPEPNRAGTGLYANEPASVVAAIAVPDQEQPLYANAPAAPGSAPTGDIDAYLSVNRPAPKPKWVRAVPRKEEFALATDSDFEE